MNRIVTSEPVTLLERARLVQCEETIERGLNTFVEVGGSLLEIRDSRLYRADYKTFEEYCHERWGWERRHAYRLIDAAKAVENVSNWTQIAPINEAQTRPLTQLEPDQQREAWQRAVETAPEGRITAAHVQSIVDTYKPEEVDDYEFNRQQIIEENRQGALIEVPEPKPHVSYNSGNNEWYTPAEYIEAARSVLGEIELDPASSEIANQTVRAAKYYTIDEDGLSFDWYGRVFMNPPYSGDLVGKFIDKVVYHYSVRDITAAVILVNNATETAWFQLLLRFASAVCFVRRRIRYIDPEGQQQLSPLQGQAFIYFGEHPEIFTGAFKEFGAILYG